MALLADSNRLLIFVDEDVGFLVVNLDFIDFGWAQRFADIFRWIVAPGNDVDFFFVADFVHDGLDTDATATNEGAKLWKNHSKE